MMLPLSFKNYLSALLLALLLWASPRLQAQNTEVAVEVYNRTYENIYIAFAYQAYDAEGLSYYTLGWYEVRYRGVFRTKLEIAPNTDILYHAHTQNDQNDHWGGKDFLMVHPKNTFWLRDARNALLAYSYDQGLSEEEEKNLQAFPFNTIKYNNEKKAFIIVLTP